MFRNEIKQMRNTCLMKVNLHRLSFFIFYSLIILISCRISFKKILKSYLDLNFWGNDNQKNSNVDFLRIFEKKNVDFHCWNINVGPTQSRESQILMMVNPTNPNLKSNSQSTQTRRKVEIRLPWSQKSTVDISNPRETLSNQWRR